MDSTFHLLNNWGKVHVDTFLRRVVVPMVQTLERTRDCNRKSFLQQRSNKLFDSLQATIQSYFYWLLAIICPFLAINVFKYCTK